MGLQLIRDMSMRIYSEASIAENPLLAAVILSHRSYYSSVTYSIDQSRRKLLINLKIIVYPEKFDWRKRMQEIIAANVHRLSAVLVFRDPAAW